MPVRDDSLVSQYIRAIENPDSLGYQNGRWTDKGVFDPNNRGFGIDVVYNPEAVALTKNRVGKWLTEDEERELRNSHISKLEKTLYKKAPDLILRNPPSEEKKAMAIGMLYRGDTVLNNPDTREAYLSGSDEDMKKAVTDYYEHKLPERAKAHNKFFSPKKEEKKKEVPTLIKRAEPWSPEGFEDFQYTGKKYSDGGSLRRKWESLPQKEKAEMMRVAIQNGVTTLPEIKEAYNKFAEGGPKWTMQDEAGYRYWRSRLPKNLRNTKDSDYDMRGAYKAGMQPMWNDEDKSYHLQSRDPESGRIFKSPLHDTFSKAIFEGMSMGYYPTMDRDGHVYTETWEGNERFLDKYGEKEKGRVPWKAYGGNLFGDGGNTKKSTRQSNSERAIAYLMSRGISRTGAAAITGTLQAESGLDPTIHAKMKGDSGEGLAQWTGSRKKSFWKTLEAVEPGAQKKYKTIDKVPFERQLDVVLTERPEVMNAISNAHSVGDATDIMLRGYENGGGTVGTMASKAQMDRIYGKWNNGYATQIKRRVGNASSLLGINFDPASFGYETPQATTSVNTIVDPETIYKAPALDENLLRSLTSTTPVVDIYKPQQEKPDKMKNFNTLLSLAGIDNPYTGLIGGGTSGLMDAVGKIYS